MLLFTFFFMQSFKTEPFKGTRRVQFVPQIKLYIQVITRNIMSNKPWASHFEELYMDTCEIDFWNRIGTMFNRLICIQQRQKDRGKTIKIILHTIRQQTGSYLFLVSIDMRQKKKRSKRRRK